MEVKWIKISTNIFDDEKILLIESLPESYAIITAWFKLLCLAGKQNNGGVFLMNNKIAYNDKMLATIFRMKESTVTMALKTFEEFGMVEIVDGVITIPHWNRHQSLDSYEKKKERDRLYQAERRANQKALIAQSSDSKTTQSSDVAVSDKELDIDIYNAHCADEECAFFERIWELYPNKKGKNRVSKKALKKIASIGEERMTEAVKAYCKEVEGKEKRYIKHGSTFFNGDYQDYLDRPTEKKMPRLGHDMR